MSDGADLKEDLNELSTMLPLLPEEVNQMRQSAHHLSEAATHLLAEAGASRQAADALLPQAQTTLAGFTTLADSLEKRIEAAAERAEAAWTQGSNYVEQGEDLVQAAAEDVDAARTELMQALFDGGTAVDQASANGETAIDAVEAAANDGATRIAAAVAAVTGELSELQETVERTRDTLTHSCELFVERIKPQFVNSAHHQAGYLFDRLAARQDQYTAHLTQLAQQVQSGVEGVVTELQTKLEAITSPLRLAAEDLRIELESLGATAATQREAVAKALDSHDQAVDELVEAKEPLPRGIEQIHDAVLRLRQQ
jgi:hypothetical protein